MFVRKQKRKRLQYNKLMWTSEGGGDGEREN